VNFFRTLEWGPWLYTLLKGAIGASVTVMLSTEPAATDKG
jgi:hypothetical protein